jgi:REP element-mobilizing transposase RayT
MKYNPDIHHRRSIRLKGYDYSQAGAYFVTICVHDRECLFGEIVEMGGEHQSECLKSGEYSKAGECHSPLREMVMNEFGRVVQDEWVRSAEIRAEIELGEFVVMPNHFHGIVLITNESYNGNGECCGDMPHCRGTARRAPTTTVEQFGKPVAGSLPTIIRSFKSAVTKRINEIRNSPSVPVWQRNYHEHVIRNEADYNRIAEYVAANPHRWIEDKLHPDNIVVSGVDIGGNGNIDGNAGIVGARCAVPLQRNAAQPGGRNE